MTPEEKKEAYPWYADKLKGKKKKKKKNDSV